MTRDIPADEQRRLTAYAISSAGRTLQTVWERYFAMTGRADITELEAHLYRACALPDEEADILTYAVNELIDGMPPLPRAPYSTTDLTDLEELREPGGTDTDP